VSRGLALRRATASRAGTKITKITKLTIDVNLKTKSRFVSFVALCDLCAGASAVGRLSVTRIGYRLSDIGLRSLPQRDAVAPQQRSLAISAT
jgi:hypothetical protein